MHVIKTKLTMGLSLVGLALWTAVAQASPATLTATVDPVTTSLSHVAAGPDGSPKVALWTLTESYPVDLQTNFGSYATCPANLVAHGDNKPNCPAGSVLGHTTATAYVTALHATAHSDAGYVFKTGANTVGTWVHVSQPVPAGVAVPGTISAGAPPFGPVITWDMSSLANGSQVGAEVDISALKFTWDGATAGGGSGNAKKLRACRAKAKRIKNKGKRRAGLRRCAKRYATHAARTAVQATATTPPFVSTGCTGGNWMFHDQLTFADQSTDTADSKVACH